VTENVATAKAVVSASTENVAGVKLPVFEVSLVGGKEGVSSDMYGLAGGGNQIQNCRVQFSETLQLLVELASMQTAYLALDNALKVTNRRVNALEHVVQPRIENTIAYVISELDEMEREEFFRLKRTQAKKKRDAAEVEDKKAAAAALADGGAGVGGGVDDSLAKAFEASMGNVLEDKDEDVIF